MPTESKTPTLVHHRYQHSLYSVWNIVVDFDETSVVVVNVAETRSMSAMNRHVETMMMEMSD